jgi:hypothetical protein
MRVIAEERLLAQRREARRGDFGSALERAEARRKEARRDEGGRVARRAGERLLAMDRTAAPGPPDGYGAGAAARPRRASAVEGGARDGADVPARPEGSAAVVLAAAGSGGSVTMDPGWEPGRAALTRAVRALPPVIEAFRASGQAGLAIDFGGAMGVELCQAPGGVEVRLAAPAALRPAARAELAGLCHALEARGVSVVSAEVRGGPPHRQRPR